MNILVIGGFGFLGGRITQFFLDAGYNVFQGTTRKLKSNKTSLLGAHTVQINLNSHSKLDEICKGIDLIIYASGMNSKSCELDPAGAFDVNAVATSKILQSAIRMKVKRFIYISTIHVYSEKLNGKISESLSPNNLHPYASSQQAGENIVLWAQKNDFIDGIVIRVSNGFGEPISKDVNCWMLLVNNLCRQAVEKKKLVLVSNELIKRNFIPISELCNVIEFLSFGFNFKKRVGNKGPINVGGKISNTLLEMAEIIQSRCRTILGFTPKIHTAKRKNEKTNDFIFDLTKLGKIGYESKSNYLILEEIDRLLIFCDRNFPQD